MIEHPVRHEQVRQVFAEALAYAPEDRATYLEKACAHDPALLREVQQLLTAHAAAGSFLSTPAAVGGSVSAAPSLSPGARLGAYGVVAVIGAGGMGEVYRARDTRLGREVAIKIILEPFAADADRVARFQREAKLLA